MVKPALNLSRRENSPFNPDEEIWIIQHSGSRTPTELRRDFIVHFKITNKHKVPGRIAFDRLVKRFQRTGCVIGQNLGRSPFVCTPENIDAVQNFFEANPTTSIKTAARELDLSVGTTWFIIRKSLKWKPYRYKRVNRLTPQNEENRLAFCNWILSKEIGFERKIIFSDEKIFVLHPSPNRQNDRVWAPWDPDAEVACRYQGDSKLMVWAALVDDSILKLRWMDDVTHPKRVTGASYLSMLQTCVWPEVKGRAGRKGWWFQQDGAPAHATDACITFLKEKFHNRVITRRGEHPWPAYSPDLNVLDYYFWGFANAEVWRQRPESLEDLRRCVEDVAAMISGDVIRAAMDNFQKRCEVCRDMKGGHFEYALERF